jgi:hypothetical protein
MSPEEATIETLRRWSQVLLWVSIVLPALATLAVGARFYVERHERKMSARITAAAIEQAGQDAAAARKELSELKDKTAPRRLSSEQRVELKKSLGVFPKQRVQISVESDHAEPNRFAKELAEVLESCGWIVQMGPWNNSNREGLSINAPDLGTDSPGGILHEALQRLRIENVLQQNSGNVIVVSVGVKTVTGMR